MRKKFKTTIFIAAILTMCMTFSSCYGMVSNLLDHFVFKFVHRYGDGENELPENVVYGSENPLAVGFLDGEFIAFWDKKNDVSRCELTVTEPDGTGKREFSDADEKTSNYFLANAHSPSVFKEFSGMNKKVSRYFSLRDAKIDYRKGFSVELKSYSAEGGPPETAKCKYSGISGGDYKSYAKNVPGGFKDIDFYIASRYELFEFFNYMVIFRPYSMPVTEEGKVGCESGAKIKLGYDYRAVYRGALDAEEAVKIEIISATSAFEDSAGYSYGYEFFDDDTVYIRLKFFYEANPTEKTGSADKYTNFLDRPKYGRTYKKRRLAIDNRAKEVTVSSSDQLYFAIKKGYRPAPERFSNAALLYDEMRTILMTINGPSTNEKAKVRNIYDYLVDTVVYDYDFTEEVVRNGETSDSDIFRYKCIYLEGVFGLNDERKFEKSERAAICDGFSKAFLCMCEMDGVDAVKISGKAAKIHDEDGNNESHAWNKVYLETERAWYLVDVTWGNTVPSGSNRSEYINHDYFLKCDDKRHIEDKWFEYPRADRPLLTTGGQIFTPAA